MPYGHAARTEFGVRKFTPQNKVVQLLVTQLLTAKYHDQSNANFEKAVISKNFYWVLLLRRNRFKIRLANIDPVTGLQI